MREVLYGTKVSLRPIQVDDTESIVRWRNHPDVIKYFIDQRPITEEGHTRWLEAKISTGEVYQFIIQNSQTGQGIGSVFLKDVDLYHRHGEYGIFIGEDSGRGKGYGTEACELLCSFAFQQLGLERVFLRVLSHNLSAIASYKKAGFVIEGVLRKHALINNLFCDIIIMGLLREDCINGKQ